MFIGSKYLKKRFVSCRKQRHWCLLQVNAKGEALHELREPTTCRKRTEQAIYIYY